MKRQFNTKNKNTQTSDDDTTIQLQVDNDILFYVVMLLVISCSLFVTSLITELTLGLGIVVTAVSAAGYLLFVDFFNKVLSRGPY